MAGGKPRGAWADKAFRDALRKAVLVSDPIKKAKKLDLLAMQLIENGLAGDTSAIAQIADRLDGKAHQSSDIRITDERMVVAAPTPEESADDWAGKHRPH